jgi:hypothetical protein
MSQAGIQAQFYLLNGSYQGCYYGQVRMFLASQLHRLFPSAAYFLSDV